MKINKIYFDMDGVLADFERGVREICKMELCSQDAPEEEERKMWDAIKDAGHFYDMLEPMPGALDMFRELSSKYECAILSAPPNPRRGIVNAKEDKINWVHRNLSEDIEINIVPKQEKKLKAAGPECLLIDDYEINIAGWNECGGTGIQFFSVEQVLERIMEIERA